MIGWGKFTALFAALLFGASASQAVPNSADIAAYRALVEQDARLASIGYRLVLANAPFCAIKERNPGWVVHDVAQYPDVEVAKAAFGFAKPIQIAALVKNGPAEAAGMKVNDGVNALDDAALPGPENSIEKTGYGRMASFKALIAARMSQKTTLPLKLTRQGGTVDVILSAPLVCASDFQIDPSAQFDAGAQGNMVSITSAFAEYAADEAELAAIVAHELAHNILQHRARLDAAKVNRGIGRSFGKSRKAILATEIEADQLSVWLLANAGYDPVAAITFWQRYRRERGGQLFSDGTHLNWSKRIAIMQTQIDRMLEAPAQDGQRKPPLLAATASQ